MTSTALQSTGTFYQVLLNHHQNFNFLLAIHILYEQNLLHFNYLVQLQQRQNIKDSILPRNSVGHPFCEKAHWHSDVRTKASEDPPTAQLLNSFIFFDTY